MKDCLFVGDIFIVGQEVLSDHGYKYFVFNLESPITDSSMPLPDKINLKVDELNIKKVSIIVSILPVSQIIILPILGMKDLLTPSGG